MEHVDKIEVIRTPIEISGGENEGMDPIVKQYIIYAIAVIVLIIILILVFKYVFGGTGGLVDQASSGISTVYNDAKGLVANATDPSYYVGKAGDYFGSIFDTGTGLVGKTTEKVGDIVKSLKFW